MWILREPIVLVNQPAVAPWMQDSIFSLSLYLVRTMLQFPNIHRGNQPFQASFVNWFMKSAFQAASGMIVWETRRSTGAGLNSGHLDLFSAASRRSVSLHACSAFLILFALSCRFGGAQESAPVPPSPLDQAAVLLNENKPREALALLTQISEKDPKTPGLEAKLGKAYFQLRRFSEATPHLRIAIQQNDGDIESSQLLALSLYHAGNCHEALPLLEKLGPRLPTDIPDAPYVASICYVMTEQLEKARTALAQMFSVAPDSAMAYLTLGKLLVRQNKVEAAIPQIETALRLQPRIAMAHFLLGEIDLYQSKVQGAVTEFQKELAVNPTMWLVYWRLGDAYMRLAKYDDAESVLKKAIWLNEASPGAFVLLGEIALKKNDPALASGFLERALAIDPQNPDAHSALAAAYKALGRDTDANQQLEISKKLRNEKHDSERDSFLPLP